MSNQTEDASRERAVEDKMLDAAIAGSDKYAEGLAQAGVDVVTRFTKTASYEVGFTQGYAAALARTCNGIEMVKGLRKTEDEESVFNGQAIGWNNAIDAVLAIFKEERK